MELSKALFEVAINILQCGLVAYFATSVFASNGLVKPAAVYIIPLWVIAGAMLSAPLRSSECLHTCLTYCPVSCCFFPSP